MKKSTSSVLLMLGLSAVLTSCSEPSSTNETTEVVQDEPITTTTNDDNQMKLGAFSVSLSVKDLTVSKEFYEKMGFTVFGGSMEQNYLIMKNETTLIGLFQGMFEGNMLTFNPGWDANAQNLEEFDDVREIQAHLKSENVTLVNEVDSAAKEGPGYIVLNDPDGNMILIDQHR